jgi:hypothetical protein
MNESDQTGYRKPPKGGQFKKGKSGNPNGRPKGVRNLKTVVEQEALAPITINENGKQVTITRMQALIKKAMAKGFDGSERSMQLLVGLIQQYIPEPDPEAAIDAPLTEQERAILESHAKFLEVLES